MAEHRTDPPGVGRDRPAKQMREAKDEVTELARDASDEVKAAAREKMDELEERADRRTNEFAQRIHAVAQALRDAGDSLDDRNEPALAGYGRDAADSVERAAGYLEHNDVRGLIGDLESAARNNTAAFLGGTFAAGLAMGRFLRSSEPDHPTGQREDARDVPVEGPDAMHARTGGSGLAGAYAAGPVGTIDDTNTGTRTSEVDHG